MPSQSKRKLHVTLTAGERCSFDVAALPHDTVAAALWLSGRLRPVALCSGLGRCGLCRVRFVESPPEPVPDEFEVLGAAAVQNGWRLGCRHEAVDSMVIEVPAFPAELPDTEKTERHLQELSCNAECHRQEQGLFSESLLLAVDLGTTSIHWRLSRRNGKRIAQGRTLNPQMGAGSDIMSRIAAACTPEGRSRLRRPVVELIEQLATRDDHPVSVCVAGNTAMTAILLDRDCSSLAAAPYSLPEQGGKMYSLPGLPEVWIPPQISPFVGGDISAGMLALMSSDVSYPFFLADMGTNGEFVLALDQENAIVASVPLGPALEGIGMRHGTMAGPGSVTSFTLGPLGLIPRYWHDLSPLSGKPQGITGTGYLALLTLLLRLGVLMPDGRPAERVSSGLAARILSSIQYDTSAGWSLPLGAGLTLDAGDVEEILKVRAAFALTARKLSACAGVAVTSPRWILAGALGGHVAQDSLSVLGFCPSGPGLHLTCAGNTSLAGAELWLREPDCRSRLLHWVRRCKLLDLRNSDTFMSEFAEAMCFEAW